MTEETPRDAAAEAAGADIPAVTAREWSAAFDAMDDAVCILDLDGTVRRCNRSMLRLLDLESDQVLGKKCYELMHGTHTFFERCPYQEMLRTGIRESFELPLDDRWYEVIADPLPGEAGATVGAVHIIRDITARVSIEQARRDSEQRLTLIYDTISDIVFSLDVAPDGRFSIASVNQRFLEATGLEEGQVVGRPVDEVIPEPSLSMVLDRYRAAVRENRTMDWVEKTPYLAGDKIGHVTVTPITAPDGTCTHLIGSVHDLTERVRAEEAVRESERLFALVYDHVSDALLTLTVDADGRLRVESVNRVFLENTGLTREDVVGKLVQEVAPEPSLGSMLQHCVTAAREKRTVRWEFGEQHPAGVEVGDASVTPVHDDDGRCRRLVVAVHDVTARAQAEQALREQTAYLAGFNALALDLAALGRDADLGKLLAARLRELTGAAGVAFSEYDPDDCVLATRSIELAPGAIRTLAAPLLRRLESTRSPVSAETYQEVLRNLIATRATLTETSFGAIPAAVDATVRRLLGVDRFIGLAYVIEGALYGTSIIALGSGTPDPPRALLDSFANLAAVSLRRRRAEGELLEKTAELDHLFALSEDIMGIADANGIILRVNPAWESAFGYTAAATVGRHVLDFVHPDEVEVGVANLKATAAGRRLGDVTSRQRHADGSYRLVEWRVSAVEGGLQFAIGRDVTEKLAAQEREEARRQEAAEVLRRASAYNRSLIETSLDPLVTIGSDGLITDVNQATVAATGRAREQLVGSDFADYFSDPALARAGYEQVFREGSVRDLPLTIRHRSGGLIDVLYNASTYADTDGTVAGVFAAARDVGALRRAEEEIRLVNADLERRVDERTRELVAANRDLQEFMYSLAHDLRGPLRAVDGFSFTVLEDYGDVIDDRGQDDLHRVRAAAQRMGVLIDALLSLSQLGRRSLELTSVDLSAIAKRIVDDLRAADPRRHVEVVIEEGLVAAGDEALIAVVLENLLGNAWKFTSRRPVAHIELGATERDGLRVFFVRDDGAGFDPAYAGKLFSPFQRLHTDEEFPGTGIGLAAVARILERLGGLWWAQGEVDRGATFSFSLAGGGEATGGGEAAGGDGAGRHDAN